MDDGFAFSNISGFKGRHAPTKEGDSKVAQLSPEALKELQHLVHHAELLDPRMVPQPPMLSQAALAAGAAGAQSGRPLPRHRGDSGTVLPPPPSSGEFAPQAAAAARLPASSNLDVLGPPIETMPEQRRSGCCSVGCWGCRGCSCSSSAPKREQPGTLREYFLKSYPQGELYRGQKYRRGVLEGSAVEVLIHAATSTKVWNHVLDLRPVPQYSHPLSMMGGATHDVPAHLFFHYVSSEVFLDATREVLSDFRMLVALNESSAKKSPSGALECWDQEPIALNVATAMQGSSDFCIPILVPEELIKQSSAPRTRPNGDAKERSVRGLDLQRLQGAVAATLTGENQEDHLESIARRARIARARLRACREEWQKRRATKEEEARKDAVDSETSTRDGSSSLPLEDDTAELTTAIEAVADMLAATGKLEEAARLLRELLALRESSLGPSNFETGRAAATLAGLLAREGYHGDLEEAAKMCRLVVKEMWRQDGEKSLAHGRAQLHLATVLHRKGQVPDVAEAVPVCRLALSALEAALGRMDLEVLRCSELLIDLLRLRQQQAEAAATAGAVLAAGGGGGKQNHFQHRGSATTTVVAVPATIAAAVGKQEEDELDCNLEVERLLRSVAAGYSSRFGSEGLRSLQSARDLAVHIGSQQQRYREALDVLTPVVAGLERHFGLGHDEVVRLQCLQATWLENSGHVSEAETILRRAWHSAQDKHGLLAPRTLQCIDALVSCLTRQKRQKEALPLQKEVLTRWEESNPEDAEVSAAQLKLAGLLEELEEHQDAEGYYRAALALRSRTLGPEHVSTTSAAISLSAFYERRERLQEAETLCRRVLSQREVALGPNHEATLQCLNNLAVILCKLGRFSEAEPLHRKALDGFEAKHGSVHETSLQAMSNLSSVLALRNHHEEAATLRRHVVRGWTQLRGKSHPETLQASSELAESLLAIGELEEGLSYSRDAVAGSEALLGPRHRETLLQSSHLARHLIATGSPRDALKLRRYIVEVLQDICGKNQEDPDLFQARRDLAISLHQLGFHQEAVPHLRYLLHQLEVNVGKKEPETLEIIELLALVLHDLSRHDEAEAFYLRALEDRRRSLGNTHPSVYITMHKLARTVYSQGKIREASLMMKEALVGLEAKLGSPHPETVSCRRDLAHIASLYKSGSREGCGVPPERTSTQHRSSGQPAPSAAAPPPAGTIPTPLPPRPPLNIQRSNCSVSGLGYPKATPRNPPYSSANVTPVPDPRCSLGPKESSDFHAGMGAAAASGGSMDAEYSVNHSREARYSTSHVAPSIDHRTSSVPDLVPPERSPNPGPEAAEDFSRDMERDQERSPAPSAAFSFSVFKPTSVLRSLRKPRSERVSPHFGPSEVIHITSPEAVNF